MLKQKEDMPRRPYAAPYSEVKDLCIETPCLSGGAAIDDIEETDIDW